MKVPFYLVSLKSLQRLSLVALFLVMSVAVIRPIDASAQDNTYTIYFDNTVGWENVYTWVWDKNDGNHSYTGNAWPGTKISLVVKNQIHGIPITVEMPTIPDWNLLSSGSNAIQAQICNNVQTPHINNCL